MQRFYLMLVWVCACTTSFSQSANENAPGKKDTAALRLSLRKAKEIIFRPGEQPTDMDSARYLLQGVERKLNTGTQATAGYLLLVKSYLMKETGKPDSALAAVENAIAILKSADENSFLGEAYMERSSYFSYGNRGELEQRINMVSQAVACFERKGDKQQQAAALQMLGDLSNIKGNTYIALEYLQRSLDKYQEIRYQKVQGIYCLMGFIYCRLREYGKALDFELKALKTAEATGDSTMQLCQIFNYLGEIFNATGDREKAITYYTKAWQVARTHNDRSASYTVAINIANTWTSLGKPQRSLEMVRKLESLFGSPQGLDLTYNIARCYISIYSRMSQFSKARPYVDQLVQLAAGKEVNDQARVSMYIIIARYFIEAGNYARAGFFIAKHQEIADRLKDLYNLTTNQKLRFMLDTARRDYRSAVSHMLAFSALNDSLSLQRKNRQIEELQVQYETGKRENALAVKEKDIQLLTRQNQLQLVKIDQDRATKRAMLVGGLLLLLIIALILNQFLINRRSNRKLQFQQKQINDQNHELQNLVAQQKKLLVEKEWLVREIHHRVKNNLQIVMSLLSSQSAFTESQQALTAILDSQHRVQAMSLIHQKLYNAENVSTIEMSLYIRELVSYLAESFDIQQRIRFNIDVETLEMDVTQAVPVGLILNEAITNAIKYAFQGREHGEIEVALLLYEEGYCVLKVADDGLGIPPDKFKGTKTNSLGMTLIAGLADDLEGNLSINNKNGTVIKLVFPYESDQLRTEYLTRSLETV